MQNKCPGLRLELETKCPGSALKNYGKPAYVSSAKNGGHWTTPKSAEYRTRTGQKAEKRNAVLARLPAFEMTLQNMTVRLAIIAEIALFGATTTELLAYGSSGLFFV